MGLVEEQRPAGTSPAVARVRGCGESWRGATPRWDKPSGGESAWLRRELARSNAPLGQAQRWRECVRAARTGEEQRPAGTSPAGAGVRAGGENWRGATPRWDKPSGGGSACERRELARSNAPLGQAQRWRECVRAARTGEEQRPAGTSPAVAGVRLTVHATTGLVPVERCSSPPHAPQYPPPRRGWSPSSDAPRHHTRPNSPPPRRGWSPSSDAPRHHTRRNLRPPRRGWSPSSDAPRHHTRPNTRRHDGAGPRRAMLSPPHPPQYPPPRVASHAIHCGFAISTPRSAFV